MKRFLLALLILSLAMPAAPALATGQYYNNTQAGAPPDCRTFFFKTWFFKLLQIRENDVPFIRATTYFIDSGTNNLGATVYENSGCTPSDSNDGLDGLGFALSGTTYTPSTQTLTKTNAFANYTYDASNPWIYLKTATGSGFTAGLYAITSKTDASDVVLSATPISLGKVVCLSAPTTGSGWTAVTSSSGPWVSYSNVATAIRSNAVLNAAYLFRCGDTWNRDKTGNTSGIWGGTLEASSYFTVGSYGWGYRPWHKHWYSSVIRNTSWTQNSTYTNVYYQATPSASLIWIRWFDRPMLPWIKISNQGSDAANLALVNTTPFSWCTATGGANGMTGSGTMLCINAGYYFRQVATATSPNNWLGSGTPITIEYNLNDSTPWFNNNGDNVRIQDQVIDGWGMCTSGQGYGIQCQAGTASSLPAEQVWNGLMVIYSGYHNAGPETNGGITLFEHSTCGFTLDNGAGAYNVINYDSGTTGTPEQIDYDVQVPFGDLPNDSWLNFNGTVTSVTTHTNDGAFYSHTLGSTLGLGIRWGCRSGIAPTWLGPQGTGRSYPPSTSGGWAVPTVSLSFPPTSSQIQSIRGFVVDEKDLGFAYTPGENISNANNATLNGYFEVASDFNANPQFNNTGAGGYCANTTMVFDVSNCYTASTNQNYVNGTNGVFNNSANMILDHCNVILRGSGGVRSGTGNQWVYSTTAATNLLLRNSLVQCDFIGSYANFNNVDARGFGPETDGFNVTNSSTYLQSNAYTNIVGTEYSNDAGAVTLANLEMSLQPLSPTSPLVGAGNGLGIQYDADWQRRPSSSPAIGPLEPYVPPPIRTIGNDITPLY